MFSCDAGALPAICVPRLQLSALLYDALRSNGGIVACAVLVSTVFLNWQLLLSSSLCCSARAGREELRRACKRGAVPRPLHDTSQHGRGGVEEAVGGARGLGRTIPVSKSISNRSIWKFGTCFPCSIMDNIPRTRIFHRHGPMPVEVATAVAW